MRKEEIVDHPTCHSEIKVWVARRTATKRSYRANIFLNNPTQRSLWLGEHNDGSYKPLTEDQKKGIGKMYKVPRQAIDLADWIMQIGQPSGNRLFSDVFVRRDEVVVMPIAEAYWPHIDIQVASLIKSIYQSVI